MISERRQFRVLYRDFLSRVIDPDLISSGGDLGNLLGQLTAILAAFNFVQAVFVVQQFRLSPLHRAALLKAAWGDEEFFLANTMAVAGMLSVVAWNNILPDRRESFVLGPLPVKTRTIFFAKAAAIGTALGVSIAAVNFFTGLMFPLLVIPDDAGLFGGVRSIAAFWGASIAAGLFVFCGLLSLQGVAATVLSYRLLQKVSGFLQLGAFFAILSVYFLTPPLKEATNRHLLEWLPSFWFLGLLHVLKGNADPILIPLARWAVRNLSIVMLVAGSTWVLTYRRSLRRMIEQPDIAPGDRTRPASRFGTAVARWLLRKPLDRAIVLFTARTIARSRQHRLMLAIYGGIALAISLAYTKGLKDWRQVNMPLLVATLVPLVLGTVGVRAVFALPIVLPANWIFKITAVHSPAAYFAAARKSLIAVAALPVWVISALLYFSIWPWRPALEHMIVLILVALLLTFSLLRNFRKIPFACSYLPGKSNLKIKVGAFGLLFLLAVEGGVQLEYWVMQRVQRFAVLASVLAVAALWARWRTLQFTDSTIQFEDTPAKDIHALDLRGS